MTELEQRLNTILERKFLTQEELDLFIANLKIYPKHYNEQDLKNVVLKVYSRLNPQTELNMISFRKTFSLVYSQESNLFLNINFFGVFRRLCEITEHRTDGKNKSLVSEKEAKRIVSRFL